MSDDFLEIEDDQNEVRATGSTLTPWKVLLVDDEPDVHVATKLALTGFEFDGKPLEYIQAYSKAEAIELLVDHDDIAVALVDVVVETEDAGLMLVNFIRNERRDKCMRIVLRTGQPGQAPERDVIVQFDINDYKEKTELSATKIFTLMYSTLRSYRDIITIEESKQGLERVIRSSASMFKERFLGNFAGAVLKQVSTLIAGGREVAFTIENAAAACHEKDATIFVAGTGRFEACVGKTIWGVLPARVVSAIDQHRERGQGEYGFWLDNCYIGMVVGDDGHANILALMGEGRPGPIDTHLIHIFVRNVVIAVENLNLRNALVNAQREVVCRLSEAVETRSNETGSHVRRVAEISKIIATKIGMAEYDAEILRLASPLHDVGKIGIPDMILNKPGKLDDAEMEVMRTHARLGYDMLEGSEYEILRVAASIAGEHHEKWDGTGYPLKLAGEQISTVARITAVVDVFDALVHKRCYKQAWAIDDVVDLVKAERGKHFEPLLVDTLLENMDEILAVCNKYGSDIEVNTGV